MLRLQSRPTPFVRRSLFVLAKEFDVIRNVNNGISYLERPELIESLKSSGGRPTDADGFYLVRARPL